MVVQTTIKNLKSLEEEIEKRVPKMTARATLICRQNSHPFQDRTLLLDQPAKVGRSVARVRPSASNAIFDCKVLSRNHALLWYENGKELGAYDTIERCHDRIKFQGQNYNLLTANYMFYLQDTRSSNGTFVNNQRLSKGTEESPPREVCSGDIVQFGVDVMENSRTAKVTHGCIVATLKIYLPDGKEAKASPSTVVLPPLTAPGNIPTQELYQLAQYLQEALHREQQLESKLATLQKLVTNSTEASESGWKALIDEDRLLTRLEILESQLQTYSKSFGDDKLRDEVSKLQDDKNNYQISAKEALMKALQEKLETLRKLQDVENNLSNSQNECTHTREVTDKLKAELEEIAEKYNKQLQEIQELTEKLQESQQKHEEAVKNLEDERSNLKSKCEDLKKQEEALQTTIEALQADNDFTHQQLTAMKVKFESIRQGKMDGDIRNVELKIAPVTETQETQVNLLIERIEGDMASNLRGALRHSEDEVSKLKRQLQLSEKELVENKDKVNELQHQLENALLNAVQSMNQINRFEVQLQESRSVDESTVAVTKHLQDEILRLEEELKHAQSNSDSTLIICKNQENGSHMNHIGEPEANLTNSLKAEIEKLKELLAETREKKKIAETEVSRIKAELEHSCNLAKKYTDESLVIRQHLQNAQQQSKDKSDIVSRLQEQLVKAEDVTKQQISALKEKLSEEQQRNQEIYDETTSLREQLLDTQQAHKQIQNEAKQMRDKIKALMDELEKRPQSMETDNSNEILTLKEDCASLRNRLFTTEAEMRKALNENSKLQSDYKKLQDHCEKLESSNSAIERLNGNQIEDDDFNAQLLGAQAEILQLKIQYNACNDEKIRLREQLTTLDGEYRLLSYQTRTIGACSVIPLILFILGVALAFYPTLASVTATNESPNPP